MKLRFDPQDNEGFLAAIQKIPGYPPGEEIAVRRMLFESGAIFKLPETLDEIEVRWGQPILVVMDTTAMLRGPESLKPRVVKILQDAGWVVRPLILQPDRTGQVHTEMPRIQAVKSRLAKGVAAISVGSGTVTDITKHACYLFEQETGIHIPYLAYQTANSVSAYTSNMTPVFVEGVKRTMLSRYPDALVCDLETLRDAPHAMTVAGVGDLLSMYIATADWYLALRLGMDPSYTEFPLELLGPLDDIVMTWADDIRHPSLEGMAMLAKLIALVGLALSVFHTTTPLSGYEHVMSHTLDMLNEQRDQPFALHGSQAALTLLLLAPVYKEFIRRFEPTAVRIESCYPPAEQMESSIRQAFLQVDPSGKAGAECWADYQVKLEKWHTQREKLGEFLGDWGKIKQTLANLTRQPEKIASILKAVGSPMGFDELKPPMDQEAVRFAFLNAPLIRRRLTLGDLLIFFGWDREAIFDQAWEECRSLSAPL
jgi:glycerol-1-phosphate dehydrogenase [NAD(P)+]